MTSSPACWAAFNAVIAREFADPVLMAVHQLSVDAWAVQHPGDGSRRAIQSVGLHLASLMAQLEDGSTGPEAARRIQGFATYNVELPKLTAPFRWSSTVDDVVAACEPETHLTAVRNWAEDVWNDMADHHDFIRKWSGLVKPS